MFAAARMLSLRLVLFLAVAPYHQFADSVPPGAGQGFALGAIAVPAPAAPVTPISTGAPALAAPAFAAIAGAAGVAGPLLQRSGTRLADVVAKIYYINIDSASPRRAHMEEMLTKISAITKVRHERFSAITREDPWVKGIMQSKEFQDSFLFKEKDTHIASGTLAAYSSHLTLMQRIAKVNENVQFNGSQPQWALVLEDDAVVDSKELQLLPDLVRKVPDDAEVIKLGMWGNYRDEDSVGTGVYRVNPPSTGKSSTDGKTMFFYMGAHGYLVRINRMPRLVKGFQGCAEDNNYWADACLMYGLVSYQCKPDLVKLRDFESQIDTSSGF